MKNKIFHGLHNEFGNQIPHSYYRQVNIDPNVLYRFMFLRDIEESKQLFDLVKYINYCFISNNTSNGNTFSINNVISDIKIDKNKILIINPIINIYNKNDKFYTLADKFVMKPIAYYTQILKNASIIIVSNSCFMCLLMHIRVKTSDIYYISQYDYSYLFDSNINFTQLIKNIIVLIYLILT